MLCNKRNKCTGVEDSVAKAALKNKFVSCPADGQNYGHLGGRKFFFFRLFFGKKITKFFAKKKNEKLKKKGSQSA